MARADTIRVKRDGPRGWHSIPAASFDPDKHQRWDASAPKEPAEAPKAPAEPAALPSHERGRGSPATSRRSVGE